MTHLGTFDSRNYSRFAYTQPDPCPTLPQAILAGLSLALFVCGGLCVMVGLS